MPGTRAGVKNEVRPGAMNTATINIPLAILIDWVAEVNRNMDQLQAAFEEIRRTQRNHIEASRKLGASLDGRLSKLEAR